MCNGRPWTKLLLVTGHKCIASYWHPKERSSEKPRKYIWKTQWKQTIHGKYFIWSLPIAGYSPHEWQENCEVNFPACLTAPCVSVCCPCSRVAKNCFKILEEHSAIASHTYTVVRTRVYVGYPSIHPWCVTSWNQPTLWRRQFATR